MLSEAELSALKVTELAVMLKERGLNAKGKKAELVVRLLESQTAEVAESSNGSAVAAQGDAGAQSEVVATDHKRPRDELEEEKVHEAAVEDKAPLVAGGVCLVVTGLVRPFTEDQAKEFVSGGVELVSWYVLSCLFASSVSLIVSTGRCLCLAHGLLQSSRTL